jgi:hypothetical protein
LRAYLQVRTHGRNPQLQLVPLERATRLAPGTLVFTGGSRRPELDPIIAKQSTPEPIPPGWVQVAWMPGAVASWRLTQGAVFRVATPSAPVAEMKDRCPGGVPWTLQDVVDIGDPRSEAAHAYAIEGQSWAGSRELFCNGQAVADDGRAFRNEQSFRIAISTPGRETCVVKRIDAGVAAQTSLWILNGADPVEMRGPDRSTAGCAEVAVVFPAGSVTSTDLHMVERFVTSALDVNAFRIEVYQRK